MKRLFVMLLFVAAATHPDAVALAQVIAPTPTSTPITIVPPGGVIDYGQAFGWLQPYVISFATALVAAAGTWLVYIVQRFTGLKIDETLSRGYILNAQNQASALIAKGFVVVRDDGKVQINNNALASAVNDLLKAVPDAASRFDLKPEKVAEKIVAMVPQVPTVATVANGTAEVSRKSK